MSLDAFISTLHCTQHWTPTGAVIETNPWPSWPCSTIWATITPDTPLFNPYKCSSQLNVLNLMSGWWTRLCNIMWRESCSVVLCLNRMLGKPIHLIWSFILNLVFFIHKHLPRPFSFGPYWTSEEVLASKSVCVIIVLKYLILYCWSKVGSWYCGMNKTSGNDTNLNYSTKTIFLSRTTHENTKTHKRSQLTSPLRVFIVFLKSTAFYSFSFTLKWTQWFSTGAELKV